MDPKTVNQLTINQWLMAFRKSYNLMTVKIQNFVYVVYIVFRIGIMETFPE